MSKYKPGLHKKVSQIFGGVPVPKSNNTTKQSLTQANKKNVEKPQLGKVKIASEKSFWKETWRQIENKFFAPKPGVSPTRQKTMTVLIPILFVVLIIVFVKVFGGSPHKTMAAMEDETVSAADTADFKIDWQMPNPYPKTVRDPMKPYSGTNGRTYSGEIVVTGIVHSRDNPSAVVNGRIVHPGDLLLGTKIVKINEDSVEFEKDGRIWKQQVQR